MGAPPCEADALVKGDRAVVIEQGTQRPPTPSSSFNAELSALLDAVEDADDAITQALRQIQRQARKNEIVSRFFWSGIEAQARLQLERREIEEGLGL